MIYLPIAFSTISGIYSIVNLQNGKEYIGSAKSLYRRASAHRNQLKGGVHHSLPLQNAYNKYGEENFEFRILEECSVESLLLREQWYINNRFPKYNVAKFVGSGMKGRSHSKKTREKIKKSLHKKFTKKQLRSRALYALEFTKSPKAKQNHSDALKIVFSTPEHKIKLSKIQRALWDKKSHRTKMSEAHKHYTPEIRKRFSDAQKIVWKKHKERLSIARRGKGTAILDEYKVREIRKLHKLGMSLAKIGRIFEVNRNTIYGVTSRRNWAWVKDE